MDLLVKALESTIEIQPKQEEFICFHGNLLAVSYIIKGEPKTITSCCITSNMNTWSLPLLEKFLAIINEYDDWPRIHE